MSHQWPTAKDQSVDPLLSTSQSPAQASYRSASCTVTFYQDRSHAARKLNCHKGEAVERKAYLKVGDDRGGD